MMVSGRARSRDQRVDVPVFDQALAHGQPRATPPFGLQTFDSDLGWSACLAVIALLLMFFTIIKGIARILQYLWMAYIGQTSI